MASHPETGSDPPIGSDRESGPDKLTLSSDIIFRYKERTRRQLIIEAALEESRIVALLS